MNIVLVGSGNTATVLAKIITAAGHRIVQVWSRKLQHAEELARQVNAAVLLSLKDVEEDADFILVAVSDKAIAEVAAQLPFLQQPVVHTAGSVSKEVLKTASKHYGVLYPLQSLRKEMVRLPSVPFLVDGNSEEVRNLLFDFARTVSSQVQVADDDTRLKLHLGAVMVSNFTNHLYALTEDYCRERQLDFKLLHPLIKEVANRLDQGKAADLQTGPARRGDEETIQRHLLLLEIDQHLQDLYRELTESIQRLYRKK